MIEKYKFSGKSLDEALNNCLEKLNCKENNIYYVEKETEAKLFKSKKEANKDMSKEDLDKIVNSILKFADLQNNREKDYIFDINKFTIHIVN